ncbi:GNAT family N-acetyltransferase [Rugosimonospora africana]|uniref:N-acetyltransferase domain-containing protein n=1 Tax=Rugosimonospora africana TaxID=556532 RepID=A0A8J3R1J1_9ACTN|nr:GNAT family N-acetyltransferase [Rugosimonospora africana]GIH18501.1 hypothetical protein Raf01_66730 [Rugosimonospora africana]
MDGGVEALAALGEKTIWEGCAAYRSAPGVTVGHRWFLTGSGYAGLNGVFLPAHGPIDLATASAPFRAAGVPMLWHLPPDAPKELDGRLAGAGYRFEEAEPMMVCDLNEVGAAAIQPAGLTIRRVTDRRDLARFAEVWMGVSTAEVVADVVRLRSANGFGPQARFEHLLGFAEGRPVACAAVFHGSAAAEVQHIVTSRGERRRGFGSAMTAAALAAVRSRGGRTAVLTASPQGEGIYSALGFRAVGVVRRFAWDPPL